MSGRFRACGIVTRAQPPAAAGVPCFFFSLGWPPFLIVVWVSAVLANRDGRRVLVTGAQGLVARVVGEDDAAGAQLVDQSCRISRARRYSCSDW